MDTAKNLILGNDQFTERVVLYDADRISDGGSLEDGIVWAIPSGHVAGLKYRENTVFGDVVLIGGDAFAGIVSYPSGEVLWSTDQAGDNVHSVELLPDGNIVFTSSFGNDIRLFFTSALKNGDRETAAKFLSFPFFCGHGLLWDPACGCLWSIGDRDLACWRPVGEGVGLRLEQIGNYPLSSVNNGGHDLSPDLSDSRYLFFTACVEVYRFDKETGTMEKFLPQADYIWNHHHKSFSQQPDGTFLLTSGLKRDTCPWKDWWKASWCADTVCALKVLPDGRVDEKRYYADSAAFYKVRSFCGRYQ
jgi:hypothetical protein